MMAHVESGHNAKVHHRDRSAGSASGSVRLAIKRNSGDVGGQTRKVRVVAPRRAGSGGLPLVVVALLVAACGAHQTTATSSSASSSILTTTTSEQTCSNGAQDQNRVSPDFYQRQYSDGLAKALKQKLSGYDSAVESGDLQQIGSAADDLYGDIYSSVRMAEVPRLFGCYDPRVLAGLHQATADFGATLDDIRSAAANTGSRHWEPADVPKLVAQAKPLEKTYVEAINAFASQFGGEQIPQ
jgi:hypothetical protein